MTWSGWEQWGTRGTSVSAGPFVEGCSVGCQKGPSISVLLFKIGIVIFAADHNWKCPYHAAVTSSICSSNLNVEAGGSSAEAP